MNTKILFCILLFLLVVSQSAFAEPDALVSRTEKLGSERYWNERNKHIDRKLLTNAEELAPYMQRMDQQIERMNIIVEDLRIRRTMLLRQYLQRKYAAIERANRQRK